MVNSSQQKNDALDIKTLIAKIKLENQTSQADLCNTHVTDTTVSRRSVKPIELYGYGDNNNKKPGQSHCKVSDEYSSPQYQSSIKGYFNVVRRATDDATTSGIKDILKLLRNNKDRSSDHSCTPSLEVQTPCHNSTKELRSSTLISSNTKGCLNVDNKKRKISYNENYRTEKENYKRKKLFDNKGSQIINYFTRTNLNTANEKTTGCSNHVECLKVQNKNLTRTQARKISSSNNSHRCENIYSHQKNETNCDIVSLSKNTKDKKEDIMKYNCVERKNNISFDDLCSTIFQKIDNKKSTLVGNVRKENSNDVHIHEVTTSRNTHLNKKNVSKSHSMGVLENKPSAQVELNSVPATYHEIHLRKERLQKHETDFNQLIQNLITKINHKKRSKNEQTSYLSQTTNSLELPYTIDEEKIPQQPSNSEENRSLIEDKSQPIEKVNISEEQNIKGSHDYIFYMGENRGENKEPKTNTHFGNIVRSIKKENKTKYIDFKSSSPNGASYNETDDQTVTENDVKDDCSFISKPIENDPHTCQTEDEESEDFLPYVSQCFSNTYLNTPNSVGVLENKPSTPVKLNRELNSIPITEKKIQLRKGNETDCDQLVQNLITKINHKKRSRNEKTSYLSQTTNSLELPYSNKTKDQTVTKNDQDNCTFTSKPIENELHTCQTEDKESEDFLPYFSQCFSNTLPTDNEKIIEAEVKQNLLDDNQNFSTANTTQNVYNQMYEENGDKDLSPTLDRNSLLDHNINEFTTLGNNEVYTAKSYGMPLESLENSSTMTTIRDDIFKTDEQLIKESPLEDFFKTLVKDTKQSFTKLDKCLKKTENKKMPVRRYKKGKVKIYKIKRLKKPKLKSAPKPQEVDENLNFDDVFKKLTQDVVETESTLQKFKSMSSISTSSSYITDHTKSDVLSSGSDELTSSQQRLRKGINELSKDKSLVCPKRDWEEPSEESKEELNTKIQAVFLKVGEDLMEKQHSSLTFRKHTFNNCIFRDGRLQLRPIKESSMTIIKSNNARSQTRFKLILYIMKKIKALLETNTKLTKRELFYQLKTLVNDQRVIDRIITTISSLLNVGSWALNIIAQKGLVFGNVKILLSSGETLNCNIRGTLIPQDVSEIVEIHSVAYFILVVEKESIFYKLIDEGLPERLTRPFIMVTGKGFPDLNTQLFLKKLWTVMSVPVFILVDADPHGINIMLNYRFGSVNNVHVSHHLAVPNAKWLGIYPSEVTNLNLVSEPLTENELKLVDHLLKTPYVECNARIVEELKVLQEKKCKAEIEGLIKSNTFLTDVYLSNKFFTHNFI